MKRILLLLAVLLPASEMQAQISAPNPTIQSLCDKYMHWNDSIYVPVIPAELQDYSFSGIEFPNHKSALRYSISTPSKYKEFNPKKDDINNIAIRRFQANNGSCGYELYVLHANGVPCDMNEFNIRINSENIVCETNERFSFFNLAGNSTDFADGTLPMSGQITISHRESGLSTTIPYELIWQNQVIHPSETTAYFVDDFASNIFDKMYIVVNLAHGYMYMMKGPVTIDVSGKDGADGSDGADGRNGHGAFTLFGVNFQATAGKPGEDGCNGENGGNGGNVLVTYNVTENNAIYVKWGGGKAGKGGKGGEGGAHGPGCGLYGKAANGRDGVDGRPGLNGSGLLYYSPLPNVIKNSGSSIETHFPYIVVDISQKEKSGKMQHKPNSKKKSTDTAENAVEF